MAKTIMVSDEAYSLLKCRKPKDMSFSEFFKHSYSPKKNTGHSLLKLLKTLPKLEEDAAWEKEVKSGWSRWKDQYS